ncbi:TAT-variant-translocated molybdopterin oxidoreductase [bacterium]|nr:TAT-variant-translocated molybdopterin oxidoreductase [bacterium]
MKEKNANKTYWRSLDELADTAEFKELVQREFPEGASEMANPLSRRNFLSLMGASLAFAGLASCRRPVEKIIPYVVKPEEIIPGLSEHYATVMPFGTRAYGVVVESHEGRPTKIEGNPKHPSSMGGTNSFIQASILGLYDPDRSKFPMNAGAQKTWADFVTAWRELYAQFGQSKGAGLAVLSESFASPTMARLKTEFLKQFPQAKWVTYDAISDENIYEGVRIATGKTLQPTYDYSQAQVILALDADILYSENDNVTAARGFADGRRMKSESDSMNRLYVVESAMTVTGGMADHRLRLQSRQIGAFTAALANALQAQGLNIDISGLSASGSFDEKWINAVAKDLIKNGGKSIVVAGAGQPASVHAVVTAINDALGNTGKTVTYREMQDATISNRTELADLVKSMNEANVLTLIMLGGNPVYNAPVDLDFATALSKVRTTIHFSSHVDETSKLTTWHIPQTHFLEMWGDARAVDGTLSVVQPLIEPLFGATSPIEMLNLLATGRDVRGYELVRETWQGILKGLDFEKKWRLTLHDGLVEGSALAASAIKIDAKAIGQYVAANPFAADTATSNDLEIVFVPSHASFDGRFANNGWLQELPNSVTKVSWDNVAIISHKTAKEMGLHNNLKDGKYKQSMIRLEYQGRDMIMPVWIQPGQADYSISVALGYGRTEAGRIGNGIGFNMYGFRSSSAPYFDKGLKITKTDKTYLVACTQDHHGLDEETLAKQGVEERLPLIYREATLEEYKQKPDFASYKEVQPGLVPLMGKDGKPLSIYDSPVDYSKGYQWGMVIDLNACIGCNACTIACQSENNIPIVGKEQVGNGREMHWIRLDRYYKGDMDQPEMVYQPVACQHCETAPCEQVCPVAATVHDKEGLNTMVYNRCVGTRYCANNCPYKVRRFNFLDYNGGTSGFFQSDMPEILKMSKNPDVSVRQRGVMEKCTYCVQRISEGKLAAKKEGREVKDGEIKSACQQGCPTNAIVFGNINDPNSQVSQLKNHNRRYDLLAELNVRPRTSYLAKLRNPNPELEVKVG